MFRYVAVCWNASAPDECADAARLARAMDASSCEWRTALHSLGAWIWHAGARAGSNGPHVLAGHQGVILGTLFRRDQGEAQQALGPSIGDNESEAVIHGDGRRLIDQYWGRYVAFIKGPRSWRVLRDPTGTIPCFYARWNRLLLFFSWAPDILRLGLLPPFTVNPDYIANLLLAYALECRETALKEVRQVLPGECLSAEPGELRGTLLWNPHSIANTDVREDLASAAHELRGSVRSCVRSWAACYDSALVKLSGGLDSSIVVSCLAKGRFAPRITCVNYYSPGADSDEREYARLAAAAAGYELVECERSDVLRMEDMLRIAKTPKPGDYLGDLQNGRLEARLAKIHGASALLTGVGGDQLFYQVRSLQPVADYARRLGLGKGFGSAALDAAQLARTTVWRALAAGIRDGWLRRHSRIIADEAGASMTLVNRDVCTSVDPRFIHPALQDASVTPPGKLRQLQSILYPPDFYDPLGDSTDPERVHPLLSQPVIELCLRIPTYVLTRGGWPRALARRAFSVDLPAQVVRRRSKGGMEENLKKVLGRNVEFVRSLLLEGKLARERLIDRNKLEEVLSGRPTTIATPISELLFYISVEAWLQSWSHGATPGGQTQVDATAARAVA